MGQTLSRIFLHNGSKDARICLSGVRRMNNNFAPKRNVDFGSKNGLRNLRPKIANGNILLWAVSLITLACSLILSRIDYCNAVLHGAPSYSITKLQRVQNNAAQIVLEAPRWSHVSPLLRTLHWLPVKQRIDYKVALLTFKVRSTSTPSYLRLLIQDQEWPQPAIDHLRFSMLSTRCLELTTTNCSQ